MTRHAEVAKTRPGARNDDGRLHTAIDCDEERGVARLRWRGQIHDECGEIEGTVPPIRQGRRPVIAGVKTEFAERRSIVGNRSGASGRRVLSAGMLALGVAHPALGQLRLGSPLAVFVGEVGLGRPQSCDQQPGPNGRAIPTYPGQGFRRSDRTRCGLGLLNVPNTSADLAAIRVLASSCRDRADFHTHDRPRAVARRRRHANRVDGRRSRVTGTVVRFQGQSQGQSLSLKPLVAVYSQHR